MEGLPVTIRLLDPPLHEFLPKREQLMVDIASLPSASPKQKKALVEEYKAVSYTHLDVYKRQDEEYSAASC